MKFAGLGYISEMRPGGVCGLLGHIVQHEVPDWKTGDRVCVAWYMRASVHAAVDACPAGWMTQDRYQGIICNEQKYFGSSFPPKKF